MRLSGTKLSSISQSSGLGNQLWDLSGTRPSLDLPFSDTKSLVDTTTGTTLVDHTRASSGTYVGSDGLIKTATTNLLLRSEEFDTTWSLSNINAFGSGSTANATQAPDGNLTADLVTETLDASNTQHNVSQVINVSSGTVYTISLFAKLPVGSTRQLQILIANTNFTVTPAANFDLISGSVAFSSNCTASIVPYPNGWYRLIVTTVPATSSGLNGFNFRFHDGSSNAYIGDGTSGFYLWGAQLEQSSTVGEYVKTTSTINSAPRFDHDPTTGESLGLLVEESRTNLLLRSEDLQDTYWIGLNVARTSGSIANPRGSLTADLLRENSSGGFHELFKSNMGADGIYTLSVFAKKGPGDRYLNLCISSGPSNALSLRVNLLTGVASSIYSEGATFSSATSSVTPFANGWYRVALGFTTSSFFAVQLALSPSDIAPTAGNFGLVSYVGDGTSGIYLWGAQLEAGYIPTSYIPTEGTTVTRAADVASISGNNFSSWYNQSEGTVFAEATPIGDNNSNQFVYVAAQGTSIAEEIFLLKSPGTNSITNTIRSSSSFQFSNGSDGLSPFGSRFKNAIGASSTSTNSAVNGVLQGLDVSVTMPTVDNLVIGRRANDTFLGNFLIKRLTYWPTRLSNETLQGITQ